jgi:hypothetical protein
MLEVDEAIIDGEVKPRCPTTSSRCRSASTLGSRWPAFLLELIDDLGQELLALLVAGALPGALQRRQRCFLARAGRNGEVRPFPYIRPGARNWECGATWTLLTEGHTTCGSRASSCTTIRVE